MNFLTGFDPTTNESVIRFASTPTRVIYPKETEVPIILKEFHELSSHPGNKHTLSF
jgi:hypothetical protein